MIQLPNLALWRRVGTIFGYGFLAGLAVTAGMMVASLQPLWGVIVLLVILPAAVAGAAHVRARRMA